MIFRDRVEAGRGLSRLLGGLALREPVVVALPRAGVVVGREVADLLSAPLEVLTVLDLEIDPEASAEITDAPAGPLGVVAEDEFFLLSQSSEKLVETAPEALRRLVARKAAEVQRRAGFYRAGQPHAEVRGHAVILIDDVSDGSGLRSLRLRAAARVLRERGALSVLAALPSCDPALVQELAEDYIPVLCLEMSGGAGVSSVHRVQRTGEPTDDEVARIYSRTHHSYSVEVSIPIDLGAQGSGSLQGDLTLPSPLNGVVIFVHGSGSGRFSPRNAFIAKTLQGAGLGTLLFSLRAAEERGRSDILFDVPLLAQRVSLVTHWLQAKYGDRELPIGYFATSTGAAAALQASLDPHQKISGIVCRGGRLDLAASFLRAVTVPTLLVVGEDDKPALASNQAALGAFGGEAQLEIIPGANRLFEQPGSLEAVAHLAADWFLRCFGVMRAPLEEVSPIR